ncbi:MAG: hypothetical protein ACE5MB_05660 [Anaerolineae bacterium]
MEMNDQTKVQILLTALERRYESIENIRERVYNISIWTLGIFLAAAGWIVQGGIRLSLSGKIFLSGVVVFALGAILFYIKDLEKGFKNQFQVAIRIEKLLRFYEPGFFGSSEKELYPQEWGQIGAESGRGRFFSSTYLLLCIGAATLIAATALSGLLF